MREAHELGGYEVLRDPCDRYVLWDLDEDAPVLAANRIVSFAALATTRAFLKTLPPRPIRSDATH